MQNNCGKFKFFSASNVQGIASHYLRIPVIGISLLAGVARQGPSINNVGVSILVQPTAPGSCIGLFQQPRGIELLAAVLMTVQKPWSARFTSDESGGNKLLPSLLVDAL